jgi:hypothetical protein
MNWTISSPVCLRDMHGDLIWYCNISTLLVYFVSRGKICLFIIFPLFGHLGTQATTTAFFAYGKVWLSWTVCRGLSIRNSAECRCWGSALKSSRRTLILAFIVPLQIMLSRGLETVHLFYNAYSHENLYITSALYRRHETQCLTCFLCRRMALSQPV